MCLISYWNIHVVNPSTQEFIKLPVLRGRSYYPIVGFGYSDSVDAYKVVVVSVRGSYYDEYYEYGGQIEVGDEMYCEVFSIKEGCVDGRWEDIGDLPCLVSKKNGVCVNGEMFWMALEDVDELGDKKIVSLDLGKNEFGIVVFSRYDLDLDLNLDRLGCVMELVELRGFLCVVVVFFGALNMSTVDIWMLEDRLSCVWVKECSIDLFQLGYIEILGYAPLNEKDGDILMWSHRENLLYSYNVRKETLRAVKQLNIEGPASLCLYFDGFLSLGTK